MTLVIGLKARLGSQVYSPKTPGYPAFLSQPLPQVILEQPAVLLTSQSYTDPELVKDKMMIGRVRSAL